MPAPSQAWDESGDWAFANRVQRAGGRGGGPAAPSVKPPPLYSFDPATGRLAVTTPKYNTAITAVTHGAYPHGGIDLARLYDGRQNIAATLRRPASAWSCVTATGAYGSPPR